MDLYILRHGKAVEKTNSVTSDSKRNLTEEGIIDIETISQALCNLGLKIDYIISSSLIRSKQTASIVFPNLLKNKKQFLIWDELKPETPIEQTVKKILSLNFSSIMIVGHEPHLSKLISTIISDSPNVAVSLKKGGFAHIELISHQKQLRGILKTLMTPKQLKKLCN